MSASISARDHALMGCDFVPTPHGVCWLWRGGTVKGNGGGRFPIGKVNGRTMRVRTAVLCEKQGWDRLPRGVVVVATCGNDLCCNDVHLSAGRHDASLRSARK